MNQNELQELSLYFEKIVKNLSLSNTMKEKAERSYKAVGEWLNEGLEEYNIKILPQGSLNLGTVIKPISDKDDYDIDLVCVLNNHPTLTAKQTKLLVGNRLKENDLYYGKIKNEGKRCWTLEYDEFHMDILPCLPKSLLFDKSINSDIRITQKDSSGIYSFKESNPFRYHEWFIIQTQKRISKALTEDSARKADIDNIPEYKHLSVLQKTIQILKRHRDIMFQTNQDISPISIIITTLAAESYRGEETIVEALSTILNNMDRYIQKIGSIYFIPNPINSKENFADKWNIDNRKAIAFFKWLEKARKDLIIEPKNILGLDNISNTLSAFLGENLVKKAFVDVAESRKSSREEKKLFVSGSDNSFSTQKSDNSIRIKNHTFYGK